MRSMQSLDLNKLLIILHNILTYAQKEHLQCFSVGFAGGGEPLLDWQILESALSAIAKQDTQKQLTFYIITNGILLNERLLESYKKLKPFVKLVISLDGDEITHDTFRLDKQGKGTFKRIMANIALYEELFGAKPDINVSVSRLSLERKAFILDFLLENNFINITFTRLFHCSDKSLEISHNDFLEFVEFFNTQHFVIRNLTAKAQNKCDCIMYGYTCGVGYNNIFYCNDKVYPCMRYVEGDKYIGHYDDTLPTIINNMKPLQKPLSLLQGVCHYEKY